MNEITLNSQRFRPITYRDKQVNGIFSVPECRFEQSDLSRATVKTPGRPIKFGNATI